MTNETARLRQTIVNLEAELAEFIAHSSNATLASVQAREARIRELRERLAQME